MLKLVTALSLALIFVPVSTLAQSNVYIDVLAAWVGGDSDPMKVVIVNKANATKQQLDIVKNVILSKESFSDYNGKFFVGWQGALEQLKSKSLPTKFTILYSDRPIRDGVTIELFSVKQPQYTGYTIPKYEHDKIISAKIRIYDVTELTNTELENVVRHEMGHALGLGHAEINESIMYPTVGNVPRYISSCELSALKAISDGISFQTVDCYSA